MLELKKIKLLLKQHKDVFKDILGNVLVEKIKNNEIFFRDTQGKRVIATITNNNLKFTFNYDNEAITKIINIELADLKDEKTDLKVVEIIKEKRPYGSIIEKNIKIYGLSRFSNNERVLLDLYSTRYVMHTDILSTYALENSNFLEKNALLKTSFESHMKTFIKPHDNLRSYTASPCSTRTLVNGQDISRLYDIVEGKDKIMRIYDLYMGIINERNSNDIISIHLGLLSKDGFGYMELNGITKKEDAICGKSLCLNPSKQNYDYIYDLIRNRIGYHYPFNCNDLTSLVNAITYQKNSIEIAIAVFEKEIGIPYKEFDELDFDSQQKLFENYRDKLEFKELSRKGKINKIKKKVLSILKK